MIKNFYGVKRLRGEEDYHSVNDSIEIEEPKIMEKKPPNDKIIAHYIVDK